jgi:copper chaperone CopZ
MNKRPALLAALLLVFANGVHAETIEMTVNGLVCGFCAQGIEKTLRKNAATEDVVVSLEHRLVAIATKPGADISDEVLSKALKDAGYEVKAVARTGRTMDTIRAELKAEP